MFTVLAVCLSLPAAAGAAAELAQVRSVYLLPMGNAFDQYLANQLTIQNVLRVVTEPQKADAIITGQIGLEFERKLEELYPPPPPPKTAEEAHEEKADKESASEAAQQEEPVRTSSFGRGRGNVFLVDRHSRAVVWSTHFTAKNNSSRELFKAAEQVVNRLRDAVAGQGGK